MDVSLSRLWCCYFFFEKVGKQRIMSNELKNRYQDVQSDSASLQKQAAPSDRWDHYIFFSDPGNVALG